LIGPRHDRDATEAIDRLGDSLVVGRDEECVDPARLFDATIDELDHRAAADDRQRLAREAGRTIPRGDESDDSGRRCDEACQPRGDNNGHERF
jgi:hypothetical protein